MSKSLIITFTNLFHKYRDENAKEVQALRVKHKDDTTFIKHAKTLNKLFAIKKDLEE